MIRMDMEKDLQMLTLKPMQRLVMDIMDIMEDIMGDIMVTTDIMAKDLLIQQLKLILDIDTMDMDMGTIVDIVTMVDMATIMVKRTKFPFITLPTNNWILVK